MNHIHLFYGKVNAFRIVGDVSHTSSKIILIWAFHTNRSAEGVSLITQALYVLVFCTRYLDIFWVPPRLSIWNFTLKNFYTLSSLYILIAMMWFFPRTREREKAWKLGTACLVGSLVVAPLAMLVFRWGEHKWRFTEFLWIFSIVLESVCVLPQLLLLRQTTVPTVIDSFYLLTLGVYRAFYIVNWIFRYFTEKHFDAISIIFGIVQTAFYVDFAWVYWTRQRVKLRNGGVVDSDDLSRGWLVSKILGKDTSYLDEESPVSANSNGNSKPQRVGSRGGWGVRGISVSAEDEVENTQRKPKAKNTPTETDSATRAEEIVGTLDEDEDDDEIGDDALSSDAGTKHNFKDVGNEWRDESSR